MIMQHTPFNVSDGTIRIGKPQKDKSGRIKTMGGGLG